MWTTISLVYRALASDASAFVGCSSTPWTKSSDQSKLRIILTDRSVKKLKKGDACRATHHIVLSWLVDTVRLTIELPSHRVERLLTILDSSREVVPAPWRAP
jgi:hypothetical protein